MMTDDLSILIADDNSTHAKMIQRYLEDESVPWNVDLKAEHHPSECLKALKDSEYDLVFLDYQFPGTTGFDVLDEIRQEGLNVPIVMLTGQGNEKVAAKAVSMDIKDYIRKEDLDATTLVESIKKALIPEGFILDENGRRGEPAEQPELLHKKESLDSVEDLRRERISSDYLWDVYNTVNAGMFVLDLEGRVQTMNRRFRSLIGVRSDQLRGAPIETILTDHNGIDFAAIKKTVQDDRFLQFEASLAPLGGETVPVFLSIRSLKTAEGTLQGILCMVLEKEEDRAVQSDLLSFYSSSTTFRGLLEPDGTLINVNPAFLEIVDEAEDEVIGQAIWDTPWWKSNEEIQTQLQDALPGLKPGESLGFQTVLYTFTGDKRYVNFKFQTVTDDDDRVVYIVVEGRDITGDRRMLESYQKSEQEYSRLAEDILDSTPTGLCILDSELNVVWMNDTTERYFNIQREEFVGENILDLIDSRLASMFENGEQYRDTLLETYERNENVDKFLCHITGGENRDERWLEYSSQPIQSGVYEGGRMEHYKDVTSLKQTQGELETTLREKETLLKEIHHRVKNNLQIISSLLSLQSKKTESAELKDAFEDSIHRIRSMAMIHEHLYQSENLDQVNFRVYIEDICEHLLETYGVKELIDVVLDVEPVELNLDTSIACGLIINELLSNAIEHGSSEDGRNRVILSFGNPQGRMIRLQVTDFGEGYEDGPDMDSPDSMGLSIVRSLAEYELDGSIQFSGENGFQATVEFER